MPRRIRILGATSVRGVSDHATPKHSPFVFVAVLLGSYTMSSLQTFYSLGFSESFPPIYPVVYYCVHFFLSRYMTYK